MPELRGYRPVDGEYLAVVGYPNGRQFTPQPDGSITVGQGTQRAIDTEEATRLAGKSVFYQSVLDGLIALQSSVSEMIKGGPKTLRDAFTLSVFGASAEYKPAMVLKVASPAFQHNH